MQYKEGDIRSGKDLGYKRGGRYTYRPCVDCGSPRWTPVRKDGSGYARCVECSNKLPRPSGKAHPRYKNARTVDYHGYVWMNIEKDDPYVSMCKSGNREVSEHRYVMAKHLRRCLEKSEFVHHKNHNKTDNRIENLQLVTHLENLSESSLWKENIELKKKIKLLETDLSKLKEVSDG